MEDQQKKPKNDMLYMPMCMCIGLSLGVALGVAMGNVGAGMCAGIGAGLFFGSMIDLSREKKQIAEDTDEEDTE